MPGLDLDRPVDMAGRVCLVTGATNGHGKAVAMSLATRGADVVILGRNRERCASVQREIATAAGKAPEVLLCDLASRGEVDRAAAEFLASGRPLHVLVNNAGLVSMGRQESPDGVELTFAVNYLACFQLSLRLLERLKQSAPARIVNVSSDTHRIASLDLDDLGLERRYGWLRAYGQSKLAIVLFTLELAKRLEGTGVTVNAVDPGPVASNIGANNPGIAYRLVRPLIRGLFPGAERAARTAVALAGAPEVERETGGYYKFGRRRRLRVGERQPELGSSLFAWSARTTGVDLA